MTVTSLTVIGADTLIRGDLQSTQGLEILGRIEGNVTCGGEVVIAAAGSVVGSVSASRVIVSGTIEGNIKGSELIAIESQGRVVGDLVAPSVGVAVGAWVRGEVRTAGESSVTVRRGAAPRSRAESVEAKVSAVAAPAEPRRVAVRSASEASEQEVITPRRATPIAQEAFRADDEAPQTPRPGSLRRPPPPPQLPTLAKGIKAKKKGKLS